MEWNIQARAHACQSCGRQFEDKEAFHTLLFDQKSGYERLDVCQKCWNEQYGQGAADRKGFVSYWQTVYTVPPAAPPEPIQKETAEKLLRKLVERNDSKDGPALYILAAKNIITATEANFDDEVLRSSTPVLVDFWAEWCGPCKMLTPVLEELATEYDGKVRIAKVNIDDHQNLAAQYRITAIPTLLVFKNGQVTEQMVGAKSKRDLKASLDKAAA